MREFVSANERHPESVRTFPWLRAAGRVAGSGGSAGSAGSGGECQIDSFSSGRICGRSPIFHPDRWFLSGIMFFCGILSGKTCFNLPSKKNVHRATSIIFSRPASHLGFLWRAETLRPISTRFAQPSPHLRSLFRFLTPRATSNIFAHSVPPRGIFRDLGHLGIGPI